MLKALEPLFVAIALLTYANPTFTFSGSIATCRDGLPRPVRNIDVLFYSANAHSDVVGQIKKVGDLGRRAEKSQSHDDVDAFNTAYGELQDLVTKTKAKVPHVKSGERGLFRLAVSESAAKAGGVILAIDLSVEDNLSAYGYEVIESPSEHGIQIFVGADDCAGSSMKP